MAKKNIEAVLNALAEYGRMNSAGYIRLNCPFCFERKGSPDSNNSFGYNPVDHVAACFRCKFKWSKGGHRVRRVTEVKPGAQIDTKNFKPLLDCEKLPVPAQVWSYVLSRGIMVPEISAGKLHYVVGGREMGRVVIPHVHPNGDWWGYTARQVPALCAYGAKASAPRGMQDDGYKVFNQVALTVDTQCPCLIMEGAIDTLRYLPEAVAVLGKPSTKLIKLLMELREAQGFMRPLVFCLDGDARADAFSEIRRLRMRGFRAVSVELPSGRDPDTVDSHRLTDLAYLASLMGQDVVYREQA